MLTKDYVVLALVAAWLVVALALAILLVGWSWTMYRQHSAWPAPRVSAPPRRPMAPPPQRPVVQPPALMPAPARPARPMPPAPSAAAPHRRDVFDFEPQATRVLPALQRAASASPADSDERFRTQPVSLTDPPSAPLAPAAQHQTGHPTQSW